MLCGIYSITNMKSGKVYIGQSNDIYHRWSQHKHQLNDGHHSNQAMQVDWKTEGEPVFVFEIKTLCSREEMNNAEIQALAAVPADKRYNLAAAGTFSTTLGMIHGEKVRTNMAHSRGGRPLFIKNEATGEEQWFPYMKIAAETLHIDERTIVRDLAGRSTSKKGWSARHDPSWVPPPKKGPNNRVDRSSRQIVAVNCATGVETTYESLASTKAGGFLPSGVSKVLAGVMRTHGDHYWRYADGRPHRTLDADWRENLKGARVNGENASHPLIATHVVTGVEQRFDYILSAAVAMRLSAPSISDALSTGKPYNDHLWRYA